MQKVLYGVVGPTASGKTSVGVMVAGQIDAEIVSADSVQIYRGMDIGSAKPTLEERQGIIHHMLDCVGIDSAGCSVSSYREMAMASIDGILSRGKLPLLVGGSGLYVSALTQPLNFAVPSDAAIRADWERRYDDSPASALAELELVDPLTAQRLHKNDKKRIVRALEVFSCSGKPFSAYGGDFVGSQQQSPPVRSRLFGLTMPRVNLYSRIDQRVDDMMNAGLEHEARAIWQKSYDRSLPAMQSIGYRQLFAYFDGDCTLEEAVARIKLDTRHFAKRQYTWFKRLAGIEWFDMTQGAETVAAQIYERILEERVCI